MAERENPCCAFLMHYDNGRPGCSLSIEGTRRMCPLQQDKGVYRTPCQHPDYQPLVERTQKSISQAL